MKRFVYTALLATALSAVSASAMADTHMTKQHHRSMHQQHRMMTNDVKNVQVLQQTLRESGFYKGAVTGQWSESTMNALASYQASKGMNPTGMLDEATAKRLGLHTMVREKVAGTGDVIVHKAPRHKVKRKLPKTEAVVVKKDDVHEEKKTEKKK